MAYGARLQDGFSARLHLGPPIPVAEVVEDFAVASVAETFMGELNEWCALTRWNEHTAEVVRVAINGNAVTLAVLDALAVQAGKCGEFALLFAFP